VLLNYIMQLRSCPSLYASHIAVNLNPYVRFIKLLYRQTYVESTALYVNICDQQESLLNAKVSVRQPCMSKVGTQGHSRSFTLISIIGRYGVAYRPVILMALYLTFPKM